MRVGVTKPLICFGELRGFTHDSSLFEPQSLPQLEQKGALALSHSIHRSQYCFFVQNCWEIFSSGFFLNTTVIFGSSGTLTENSQKQNSQLGDGKTENNNNRLLTGLDSIYCQNGDGILVESVTALGDSDEKPLYDAFFAQVVKLLCSHCSQQLVDSPSDEVAIVMQSSNFNR